MSSAIRCHRGEDIGYLLSKQSKEHGSLLLRYILSGGDLGNSLSMKKEEIFSLLTY